MNEPMSVIKGTLDLLVLKALSWQPMHGFEVTHWLEQQSGDRLALEDAALYQALYRLEQRGLVEAEWGVTAEGRRARYYDLTPAGRRELRREMANWFRYAETFADILAADPRARDA
jgi:transcriptional regulator